MSVVQPWVAANLKRSGVRFYAARGFKAIAETTESLVAIWPWPLLWALAAKIGGGVSFDLSVIQVINSPIDTTWMVAALIAAIYYGRKEYEQSVRCTYGSD